MLSSGVGKNRMAKTTQGLRPRLEWRLFYISSGEMSLADHVATVGKRLRGGAEVRLVYVPANAGMGLGLFEDLHTDVSGCQSAHEFAQLLRSNTNQYYGTPLRLWLEILTKDLDGVRKKAHELSEAFVKENCPTTDAGEGMFAAVSGEVLRVLDMFGCVAAAGELATEYGITGWPAGEASRACAVCFRAWLAWRGSHGSSDLEAGVRQVRLFCERYEAGRFEVLGITPEEKDYRPIQDRLGYRKIGNSGETLRFYVLPEAWRAEVCKSFDAQAVAQELKRRKLLKSGPGRLQLATRIKGEVLRVYAISGKILRGRNQ
jgi:putative DNA primase/helicase